MSNFYFLFFGLASNFLVFRSLKMAPKDLPGRTFLTFKKHPQAVYGVGDHVKSQAYHDQFKDLVFDEDCP